MQPDQNCIWNQSPQSCSTLVSIEKSCLSKLNAKGKQQQVTETIDIPQKPTPLHLERWKHHQSSHVTHPHLKPMLVPARFHLKPDRKANFSIWFTRQISTFQIWDTGAVSQSNCTKYTLRHILFYHVSPSIIWMITLSHTGDCTLIW